MSKKVIKGLLLMVLVVASMTACGKSGDANSKAVASEKKSIKLGVRADLLDYAKMASEKFKEKGYEIKIVTFDDSVAPDVALAEGSIDANMYQHEPYLKNYNASKGTDLVMVQPKLWSPVFGMYSNKYKSYDQIPEGATIGVCNDATNQVRGLKLLNELGLIKLPADIKEPTIYDVQDNATVNPKKIKFIEAEMATLPQSLKDVDCILVAGVHMVAAGLDGSKYIATPKDSKEYAVGVAVKNGNQKMKWVKDLNESFMTESVNDLLKTKSKGTLIPQF